MITLPGIELTLLPEGAVWVPAVATVLVADVHLGKPETFQHYGIPIPAAVNGETLARLQRVCDRIGAQRLIILGDLFHSRVGLVVEVAEAWQNFLAATGVTAELIIGNHDRPLKSRLTTLDLTIHQDTLTLGDLTLSHEPLEPWPGKASSGAGVNVCGHVHPCVQLGGRGDRLRLPCFYWQPAAQRLTLPAFGAFTGGHPVSLQGGAIAYALAEDTVVPLP